MVPRAIAGRFPDSERAEINLPWGVLDISVLNGGVSLLLLGLAALLVFEAARALRADPHPAAATAA